MTQQAESEAGCSGPKDDDSPWNFNHRFQMGAKGGMFGVFCPPPLKLADCSVTCWAIPGVRSGEDVHSDFPFSLVTKTKGDLSRAGMGVW